MRKVVLRVMGIIALLSSLLGCTNRTESFAGEVEGRRLQATAFERRVPFSDTFWTTLRWGDLPPIAVDSESTSPGAPYSLDVYRGAPVAAADGATQAYSNAATFDRDAPVPVMLYLDPAKFSRGEFDQYAAFFESGWPQVADRIGLSQGYRQVAIVGLVHGRDADFVQRFERAGDAAGVRIEVWTDGSVHYRTDRSISSSNLSAKVQMPGSRILLRGGGPFTMQDLQQYRDAAGRALTEVFEVVEEP